MGRPLTKAWTDDELDRLGPTEELQIAPRRSDGSSRRPVVLAGEELSARAAYGAGSGWHRAGRESREARMVLATI